MSLLSADKGNAILILNTIEYEKKGKLLFKTKHISDAITKPNINSGSKTSETTSQKKLTTQTQIRTTTKYIFLVLVE